MSKTTAQMLDLECPGCGVAILVSEKQQVEGEPIDCPSCGAALVLARETESEGENWHWVLVDLEEESDNEK